MGRMVQVLVSLGMPPEYVTACKGLVRELRKVPAPLARGYAGAAQQMRDLQDGKAPLGQQMSMRSGSAAASVRSGTAGKMKADAMAATAARPVTTAASADLGGFGGGDFGLDEVPGAGTYGAGPALW